MPITTLMYPPSLIIPTFYPQSGYVTLYTYSLIVSQISPTSSFYRGGSSLQPSVTTMDDIRWQPRMTQYLSTEERDEDEDEARGEDEDKEDEELKPQLRKNPPLT